MTLLKWPRRLIVVCRGETATDVVLREAEAASQSVITLPDRPQRAPLTPNGLDSARDAGKRLFAAGLRPNAMFVAPDLACRQAAAAIMRAIGYDPEPELPNPKAVVMPLPGGGGSGRELDVAQRLLLGQIEVFQEERLRDLDPGCLVGFTAKGRTQQFDVIYRVDPGLLLRRPPGGESHADVALRVRSFLSELGRELAGETLLLVTHRAVLHAIRRLLDPQTEEAAERLLATLDEGPPPWEIYEERGPVARRLLLQGYYRMADLAQVGARTALSRIRRRGEGDPEEAPPAFPDLPQVSNADVRGRVLITYLSAGNGHRIAAQALETDLRERYPGVEVRPPEDLANFSRPGKWGAQLFYKVIDWHIYHRLYDLADRMPSSPEQLNFLRQQIMQLASRKFVKLVMEYQPDIVVNTHPLGTELTAGALADGKIPAPVLNYQVVTDCYGHNFYVLPSVHATFVPNRQVADQLYEKGMPAERLYVTGIPVHPAFADRVEQKVARQRLGLTPSARVVLVQGNLIDEVGMYDQLLEYLVASFPQGVHGLDVEVVVVCGKAADLHRDLQALARAYTAKVRLVPFGMVPSAQMRDIMRASDLSLTKPGGLTTAESIAMELPMVLLEVMGGGQEGYNAQYFQNEGVAAAVYEFEDALKRVAVLLDSPETLLSMRQAAARVSRPRAAGSISDVMAAALVSPKRQHISWPVAEPRGERRLRIGRLRPTRTRS